MRVVTQDEFGGPDVLRLAERPLPEPELTEIRVRVMAAGVNPVDQGTRAGGGVSSVLGPPPFVLGWDVSGVVDAVAPGVTRFEVGDEVFGMPWFPREAGCYAEYVTAPAGHFAIKPAKIDHEHAGGLALAGITAWRALVEVARVEAGERVLVHAAAGGVGHLAVQIAKARGAEVVGTARAGKHALLTELGADQLVDYTRTGFETATGPVDVVIDLVGGDYTARSVGLLRPGGRLVHIPSIELPGGVAEAAAERGGRAVAMLVEPDHQALQAIAGLVDAGSVRVLVEQRFPLAEAAAAHELGERTRTTGKIVLVP